MKENQTTTLQIQLERHRTLEAAQAKDRKTVADAATELAGLEITIDLGNASNLQKAAQLQTIGAIGPKRMQARARELGDVKAALQEAAEEFAAGPLRARMQDLQARALDKVEGALRQHYGGNSGALREAASRSTLLLELSEIMQNCTLDSFQPENSPRFAARLLNAWKAAEAFEKKAFEA